MTPYDFIIGQIKDLKYTYDYMSADMFRQMAEVNYGITGYSSDDWQYAFVCAAADVFGGGCEVETY